MAGMPLTAQQWPKQGWSLEWQCQANQAMAARTGPVSGPVFSEAELSLMGSAQGQGWSPEAFAEYIVNLRGAITNGAALASDDVSAVPLEDSAR